MPKIVTALIIALLVTAFTVAKAANSAPAKSPTTGWPPEVTRELTTPEIWFTPQLVRPGAQPVATDQAREQPNRCSFPIRFWGYADTPHKYLADGNLTFHIIKAISYQGLNGRTLFETDNFNVFINRDHPDNDWRVTGRFGNWFLGSKLVWLENGPLSVAPSPEGEKVTDPHPTRLSTQPDLCRLLAS